jgi:hypothetical protein
LKDDQQVARIVPGAVTLGCPFSYPGFKSGIKLSQLLFDALALSDVNRSANYPQTPAALVENAAPFCVHPPNYAIFFPDCPVLDVVQSTD